MRAILAVTFALFVLLAAGMPHVHADAGGVQHDPNACLACATATCEPGTIANELLEPPTFCCTRALVASAGVDRGGAPLGAIPGQSPPAR